jgi:eukaryotic-like serine/threonine-protein kinase
MSTEHERLREVYLQASEIASMEGRRAFLAEICGKDAELRRRVEELLEMKTEAGLFFGSLEAEGAHQARTSSSPAREKPPEGEGPGAMIGRYKLLEQIGEGGFGVVYMAEQIEPVKRRVALKIIKLGMDTREVIARFDAERQALAMMDHLNVARVLDAGATTSGRPFFVMELVKGLPITEFCDRNCLTPQERIKLFREVCHAAQHAHSKGVIHRDLKPSNILVTIQDGRPVPKVIDFGIAKAIDQPLTQKTLFTRFGQMVGTPVYMSPEHVTGGDVDTRSDVYSLGVILYELLTGKQPFDLQQLRQAGYLQMLRLIEEEEPLRPSTRLTKLGNELAVVAHCRHVNPRRLSELVRGDLDWITMKALQKDRTHRYATAIALAEDLERYLEHRPVVAGPPTFSYRGLKFAQRHRYAVATAVWIVLALMVGLAAATYGFLKARDERELALAAERTAEQQRQIALLEARRAQAKELRARQVSYASDMALASHALGAGNLGRVLSLLNRHTAVPAAVDLRDWEWRYLWQQCQSAELFQLGALSNSVLSVAVSADGHLASATDLDGQLTVWDLQARALLWSSNSARLAAFSHDGKILADGQGLLHDADSGIVLGKLPARGEIGSLVFSSNGELAAGLTGMDHVCVWDAKTWRVINEYPAAASRSLHLGAIAMSPDGQSLAIGTGKGQIRLLHTRTGEVIREWKAQSEGVTAVALSPDSKWVASAAGFSDCGVKIWRLADGTLERTLLSHRAWVSSLAFSPDSRLLASASADQTLGLWDSNTWEVIASLHGHLHEVWCLAFAQDGRNLISGGKDGSIKVWRVPSAEKRDPPGHELRPEQFAFTEGIVRDFAFTPDSREVLGKDQEGWVTRWALPSLRPLGRIEQLSSNNFLFASSPKLGLLAAVDRQGAVRVWDYGRQQLAGTCRPGAGKGIDWVGFADGGRCLVTFADGRRVTVWNTASWAEVASWESTEPRLGPMALSPDGHYLAAGSQELLIFNLTNGTVAARISAHKISTDAVAFAPDGKLLATGSQEGLARLWRTDNWQPVGTLRGHLLGVHSLAFSPDSRRLATGSLGSEGVKLWDLATAQEVLNLSAPGDLMFWLGFSPDGRTLLALTTGTGLRAWSAPLLEEIRRLEEIRENVAQPGP